MASHNVVPVFGEAFAQGTSTFTSVEFVEATCCGKDIMDEFYQMTPFMFQSLEHGAVDLPIDGVKYWDSPVVSLHKIFL